jgi:hypothetical protein
MIIPYGIHDVHGTTNWLRLQPTLIPWIPHGIPDGFHGFHMDSIWINPGKVKTSMECIWSVWGSVKYRVEAALLIVCGCGKVVPLWQHMTTG